MIFIDSRATSDNDYHTSTKSDVSQECLRLHSLIHSHRMCQNMSAQTHHTHTNTPYEVSALIDRTMTHYGTQMSDCA